MQAWMVIYSCRILLVLKLAPKSTKTNDPKMHQFYVLCSSKIFQFSSNWQFAPSYFSHPSFRAAKFFVNGSCQPHRPANSSFLSFLTAQKYLPPSFLIEQHFSNKSVFSINPLWLWSVDSNPIIGIEHPKMTQNRLKMFAKTFTIYFPSIIDIVKLDKCLIGSIFRLWRLPYSRNFMSNIALVSAWIMLQLANFIVFP